MKMHNFLKFFMGALIVISASVHADSDDGDDDNNDDDDESVYTPAGQPIPTSTNSKKKCWHPGELEAKIKNLKRITVTGCANAIVEPSSEIPAELSSPYVQDGKSDTVLCSAYRKNTLSRLITQEGLNEMVNAANEHYLDPSNATKTQCAVSIIYRWAKDNGYAVNKSGWSGAGVRAWNMGSFATAYLKSPGVVQMAKEQFNADGNTKHSVIKNWFKDRGEQVFAELKSTTDRNNIYYWKAHSVLAMGLVTKNDDMIKKAKEVFNYAISEISSGEPTEKGFLPREVKRGKAAVTYHGFAMKALFGMVALSKAVDCNFLAEGTPEFKLSTLLRKTYECSKKPEIMKEKTGVQPTAVGHPHWVMPLLGDDAQAKRMFKDIDSYLKNYRDLQLASSPDPHSVIQLGGYMSYYPEPGSLPYDKSGLAGVCN